MASEGREFHDRDAERNDEAAQMLFTRRRGCCCMPCFGSDQSAAGGLIWWRNYGEGWWTRGVSAVMKLREWSELAAGPRWKTFIRRFNRDKSGAKQGKFQYDPLSYALNFDDGMAQSGELEEEEEYWFPNFSMRFASNPGSAKSSVDLGKDTPTST